MQKGFTTLEVVLATLIIVLLMKVAVPNAVRLVDRIALDYETKRLYSELRFVESANRSDRLKLTGTGLSILSDEVFITFTSEPPSYQVVRGSGLSEKPIREPHALSYGVKVSSPERRMNFGTQKIVSNQITLTSRLGKTKAIAFDSVGRMRGD